MLEKMEHGEILEIRMAHPPVNALGPETVPALTHAITEAPRNGARAVVLSGQPGMFSAGLDVPALLKLDRSEMAAFWNDFISLLGAIACSPVPLAAAITGHSPAGGAVMSLYADYRVMADGAFKTGLNEVQVGLPLPSIIHAALVRQIGARQAERLAAGGIMMTPSEALNVGFIDEIVPPESVVETALAWCEQRLKLPPRAMSLTREFARRDLMALFGSFDESSRANLNEAWFSEETQATMRALMENLKKKK